MRCRIAKMKRRSLTLVDALLFVRAFRLAGRAQGIRKIPVSEVVAEIARRGGGGRGYPRDRVEVAVERATGGWRRWFAGLDTCLTRSLVLGGMLAGSGDVVLNIGFRPDGGGRTVDGHAWVTLDGDPVGPDQGLSGESYTRVLAVAFHRTHGE
jgi:hypothetical protein